MYVWNLNGNTRVHNTYNNNLFLCNLSALCTFACSALIISIAKRAGNLRFYLHHHLH